MTPDSPERIFPSTWPRIAAQTALVAAVSYAWMGWVYRIWDRAARVPIYNHRSDVQLIGNHIKNIVTQGWYQTNPDLGAPYGQAFYDFPHGGETFQLAALKGLSLFSSDWALIMNTYYVAGFGVTAAVTFLVLRHLRFSFPVAGVAAVLYTFLPFHFVHNEQHLYRSSYYFVPIACLLLVWAMSWRTRFLVDPDPPAGTRWRGNLRWRRVLAAAGLCALLAGSETMTVAFTMTLLALVSVIGAVRHREPARLVVGGAMIGALAVVFLALLWPTLNYYLDNGTNEAAARRLPSEQERYGLKPAWMLIPDINHRIEPLGDIREKIDEGSPVVSEDGQTLTVLGSIGFIGALYGLITKGWGWPGRDRRVAHDPSALRQHAGLVALLATLVGSVAGFALILSAIGFSQIRVWNRIVLVIAFFSLIVTALWFERLAGWLRGRLGRPRVGLAALALVVLAFGLFDGGTTAEIDYDRIERQWERDRAFVAAIEAQVPDGTMVFQLPIIPFPEEPPPGRMLDYDHLRPWLQSDGSTRWSYGAVRGREEARWQVRLRDNYGVVTVLPELVGGIGYTGVWVDRLGYRDGGEEVYREMLTATGLRPTLTSPTERYWFYDLRPYAESLTQTRAELLDRAEELFGAPPPS